ncbi:MAG TPA: diguanylate cyclase [Rhizobacter sp.]
MDDSLAPSAMPAIAVRASSRNPLAASRTPGLWLAIALGVCVATSVVAYHLAQSLSGRSQAAAASRSLATVSAALDAVLARHESLPRMLALDPRLAAALATPRDASTIEATNAYLAEIALRGDLLAAFLIDAKGNTIAASNWNQPVSFVGQNYAFRPYFRDALEHGTGRFYAVGATSGTPGYFLASRVAAPGAADGVVAVKVALDTTVKTSGEEHAQRVAVVDEFGVVFLASDPSHLYRPVARLSDADLATLNATQRYGKRLGPPILPPDAGTQGQVVEHRIEGRPWKVVSFMDRQPARSEGLLGALAGALAAALVVALALVMRQRRLRAIEQERAREQLSQSRERLHAVVENLPVMVCFVSADERYVFANALYAQQYGQTARALEGKATAEVLSRDEYEAVSPYMKRALAGETVVFEREYRHTRQYRCFEATYRPEWNHDRSAVTGVHVMTQDVTQTRQRLRDLARLSQLDHLTQLMNRKGFEAALENALASRPADGTLLALLFIDLDGFKPVNDTHGHAAGDAVLTAFGKRVSRLVREDDVVARLGGDEFAVLLPRIADTGVAERVAQAIVDLAQRPFSVDADTRVSIGASVGIACLPAGRSLSPQALCHSADTYLYDAKKRGRRTFSMGEAVAGARLEPVA